MTIMTGLGLMTLMTYKGRVVDNWSQGHQYTVQEPGYVAEQHGHMPDYSGNTVDYR